VSEIALLSYRDFLLPQSKARDATFSLFNAKVWVCPNHFDAYMEQEWRKAEEMVSEKDRYPLYLIDAPAPLTEFRSVSEPVPRISQALTRSSKGNMGDYLNRDSLSQVTSGLQNGFVRPVTWHLPSSTPSFLISDQIRRFDTEEASKTSDSGAGVVVSSSREKQLALLEQVLREVASFGGARSRTGLAAIA